MMGKLKKAIALIMCFVMVICLASCSHGYGQDASLYEQVDSNEKGNENIEEAGEDLDIPSGVESKVQNVSMELFQASMPEGKNGMISPVSILMAMAMVETGADGESLLQMEEAFGCSAEEFSNWLYAWKNSLVTSDDTNMNVANSFWYRNSSELEVKEEYLKNISRYFDADAYEAAFNQSTVDDMNRWVKKNTYRMIERITDRIDPQNMAVILNATAFEGAWQEPYEEFQIRENEDFYCEDSTVQKVSLMHSRENIYLENEMVTGFKKPYKDGYSFIALLPKEGSSIKECIDVMDGDAYRDLMEGARSETVSAAIPEFSFRYTLDHLIEIFGDMGITDIFSKRKADLSGMAELSNENLYVTGILHKTFIEVNRTGTRAAAVTEIKCGATAAVQEKLYEVRLDRPFIYVIVDDATNTPIFIGTVMNPAAGEE